MSNIWGVLAKYLNNKNSVVTLDGDFFNMEFEVITSETHSWTAQTTSNPVEKGEPVSDHVQREPDTLQINGIISNASVRGKLGTLLDRMAGGLSLESPVQQAFDKLYALMEDKRPMTVYTQYKIYSDMVLTSLSIPRSPESGESIEFNATFTHVRCVSTMLVSSEDAGISSENAESESASRQSSSEANRGKVPTEPVSQDVEADADSTYQFGTCGPDGCQTVDTGRQDWEK